MVYEIIAGRTPKDKERLGLQGTIFLGKHYVQMERIQALSNPVYLDVSGPHVVLLSGKRGSGKCLLPNSRIILDSGLHTIEGLFNITKGFQKFIKKTANEELLEIKNVRVLSLNNNKFEYKAISHIYRKKVNEILLTIRTASGKSVTATKEHPLLAKSGQEKIWLRADKLKVGKVIACFKPFGKKLIWEKIAKIIEIKKQTWVYDLTVPETHNFIANNIVCHNSYSIGVIAEGLADLPEDIKNNLSFLIFDTMGIFWTMKYPNYKDDALLREWNLQPKGLQPVVFVPYGLYEDYQNKGVPVDFPFSIEPREVSAESWAEIFGIDLLSDAGILLERAVEKAKQNLENFEIDELTNLIEIDKEAEKKEKQILKNRLAIAKTWGLFKAEGTEILDLFKGGTTTILDLSAYAQMENSDRLKALVIGLVSKKILSQRMESRRAEEVKLISEGGFLFGEKSAIAEKGAPLVWMMIDEAHEFLPRTGKTLASDALIQILREGRQPGISLVLATQQPGKIHTDVMTQADVVISHRVTSKIDLSALNEIAATYLAFDIQRYIDDLPAEQGTAILLDDKLEKIYPMKVRPRYSWHGGEDPTAIKGQLKEMGLA